MKIRVTKTITKEITCCYHECPYFMGGGCGSIMICTHPEAENMYIISHPECDIGFPQECPLIQIEENKNVDEQGEEKAAKSRRRRWKDCEVFLIRQAVTHIKNGVSVYSQVKELQEGLLVSRTWESIRSKINRIRRSSGRN